MGYRMGVIVIVIVIVIVMVMVMVMVYRSFKVVVTSSYKRCRDAMHCVSTRYKLYLHINYLMPNSVLTAAVMSSASA